MSDITNYALYFANSIARDAHRPALVPLESPCDDCAVTGGLYTEISEALAEQPLSVQRAISEKWDCHDHRDRACRGNINLLAARARR